MNTIALTYIDDTLDPFLLNYLDDYSYENVEIEFEQCKFEPGYSYQDLLNLDEVKNANCIVIDSKLFEEKNALNGKFSGEEFELILQLLRPYIGVIVVSSKEIDPEYDVIPKWASNRFSTENDSNDYYDNELKPRLNTVIKRTLQYRSLASRIQEKEDESILETDLLNSVLASLQGIHEYEPLRSEKIDELIDAFKGIKELI